jgi:three-Cys-motif partner protein
MSELPKLDEIGFWSEIKLEIVKDYAKAYSTILSNQTYIKHVYIDAFAGAGTHISKTTKEIVPGSPLNALYVEPPFKELYLIDLDGQRTQLLEEMAQGHQNVHVFQGNCNDILLEKVFPEVTYEQYRRGLCLLDPYGLHLNWDVLEAAGKMRSIEIFLNFPIMDMNRNALWKNPDNVDKDSIVRMTAFWGDESWKEIAYAPSPQLSLFSEEQEIEKQSNEIIVEAFRTRLIEKGNFKFVPKPIPMKNTTGATVYYLFFASNNQTGEKIAKHIFNKPRSRGGK